MSASNPAPLHTSSASRSHPHLPASSFSSIGSERSPSKIDSPSRPKISSRKSSGTIIVPRDDPNIELQEGDETFDADDARAMSPRRTSEDLEKMGQDARRQLSQQAKILHESLLEIFNRIDAVKQEHDKLDSNNKFLQKYIGDLMSTSKITASGASGRKK